MTSFIIRYQKRVFWLFIAVVPLLLLTGGGLAFAVLNTTTNNTEPVRIYLPHSDTALDARDTLIADGLVDDGPLFNTMAGMLKLDEQWREGSYVVEAHTPVYKLIKRINRGQQDPMRLTIGKFRTPDQLNEYLDQKLMHDTFNFTLSTFHLVLPDTYEFYWTVTPEQFMQRMEKEYNAFWSARECEGVEGSAGTIDQAETIVLHSFALHGTPCTPQEIIILASIVEEETNHNPEKPLIASVYLNRLKRGMPLQADPTVKYAVGDFTLRRILNKHLEVESPFNTYLHTGLPPAPICLPSKATIDAVLNAPETNYLYFCASDKMDGTHRFAATLAEHNRNADAFHRALNKKGIK